MRRALQAWTCYQQHCTHKFHAACMARRQLFRSLCGRALRTWHSRAAEKQRRVRLLDGARVALERSRLRRRLHAWATLARLSLMHDRDHRVMSTRFYAERRLRAVLQQWGSWVRGPCSRGSSASIGLVNLQSDMHDRCGAMSVVCVCRRATSAASTSRHGLRMLINASRRNGVRCMPGRSPSMPRRLAVPKSARWCSACKHVRERERCSGHGRSGKKHGSTALCSVRSWPLLHSSIA